MALNPDTYVPFMGRTLPISADYPYGATIDQTVPESETGTPIVQGLHNDNMGFHQSLLTEAGVVPNGNPDTVQIPQYLDALKIIIAQNVSEDSPIIVDGGMNTWPEGYSIVTTNDTDAYCANNFIANPGLNGTVTASREDFVRGQVDVPGNPLHFLRFNQSIAATAGESRLRHRIEFADRKQGEEVTLNFYAMADSAFSVDVELTQNFGTGGAPSAEIVTVVSTVNLTTNWQKISVTFTVPIVTGQTFGTNGDDYFQLSLLADFTVGTFILDTTNWWIGAGEFPVQSAALIAEQAGWYVESSYFDGVALGTVTDVGRIITNIHDAGLVNGITGGDPGMKFKKRAVPAVTLYSTGDGAPGNVYVIRDAANELAAAADISRDRFVVQVDAGAQNNRLFSCQYFADARL